MFEDGLIASDWLKSNAVGLDDVSAGFEHVPVADFADRCGIDVQDIQAVARRINRASSVSVYEDLGVEMAPHSTLVSYLQRLLWLLVGSYGVPGGMTAHTSLVPLFSYRSSGSEPVDPVTGGAVVSGLIPCNEIAEGILSEHPERTRALFIESANPVHSLAESAKFRQAMRAAELTIVIDIAMTETAVEADWVLPAASQYEKVETTFFGMSFPDNWICLRPPLLDPLEGSLPEPEIHSRLLQALGVVDAETLEPLRAAAETSWTAFAEAFMGAAATNPRLAAAGAVVLYETIGKTLPPGMEGAAPLWFSAQQVAMRYPDQVRAAGHKGEGVELGNVLFQAMVDNPDGVVFTRHEHGDSFDLLRTPDHKVQLAIPQLLEEIRQLADAPVDHRSDEFPFVLSAGERRSFTANTIMRDPSWRKKDAEGALRLSPTDAAQLGVESGSRVRITTAAGTAVAVAEVNETMMDGHVSLPNGMGLAYSPAGGEPELTGVAPNELTSVSWKDPIVGTPWHKHVPAQLEAI
jgi:formate dehydrogenase